MEEKERTNQERYKSRTFWQEGDTIELKHGWRSCDGWCSGHPRASGALLPPATIPQRPSEGLVRPENPESLSLNCQSGCSLHPIPELTFYTPVLPYLFFLIQLLPLGSFPRYTYPSWSVIFLTFPLIHSVYWYSWPLSWSLWQCSRDLLHNFNVHRTTSPPACRLSMAETEHVDQLTNQDCCFSDSGKQT